MKHSSLANKQRNPCVLIIWLRESIFLEKKVTENKWKRMSTRAAVRGVPI
jgi:hypothetical protein